jgi:hypothetical protein
MEPAPIAENAAQVNNAAPPMARADADWDEEELLGEGIVDMMEAG